MMDEQEIIPMCPHCEKSDRMFKVNRIYLESLTVFEKKEPHPILNELVLNKDDIVPLPNIYGHEFTRLFSPPSGKSEILRILHPDIMILVFGTVLLFFLYNAYIQQPSMTIPLLVILGISIVVYFIFRGKLIEKYENGKNSEKESYVTVEQAVGRWMKLYYCARDGIVVDVERNLSAPLDEMREFLMRA